VLSCSAAPCREWADDSSKRAERRAQASVLAQLRLTATAADSPCGDVHGSGAAVGGSPSSSADDECPSGVDERDEHRSTTDERDEHRSTTDERDERDEHRATRATRRSAAAFAAHTGIDFIRRTVSTRAAWGGLQPDVFCA
jgi:hypothetical protein